MMVLCEDRVVREWRLVAAKRVADRCALSALKYGVPFSLAFALFVRVIAPTEPAWRSVLMLMVPACVALALWSLRFSALCERRKWVLSKRGVKVSGSVFGRISWSRVRDLEVRALSSLKGAVRLTLWTRKDVVFDSIVVRRPEEELKNEISAVFPGIAVATPGSR